MSRRIIEIPVGEIVPSRVSVFKGLGISENENPGARALNLADEAMKRLIGAVRPVGIISILSRNDFAEIYEGDGRNEPDAPLGRIFGASENLAAFIVTLGEGISNEIGGCFGEGDMALAALLDSAASEAAELAADYLESFYNSTLNEIGLRSRAMGTMRFSPGYCGWHIGVQKKLFAFLRPEEIGISLTDTFLMQPLKSISGVFITGRKDLFNFDDNFSFCSGCATHSCKERITKLLKEREKT